MNTNAVSRNSCLLLASMCALSSGCATYKYPSRQDPFARTDIASAPPAFPGLNLAVMLSENTKNTIQVTYHGSMYGNYNAREAVDRMFAIYRRNFKTVVQVERAEDARQANADLIALIDDYAPKMGLVNREETTVMFLTLDNQKIDELTAAFEKRMGWNTQKAVDAFSDAINGQLESAMRKSPALADFAKAKSAGARPQAADAGAGAAPAPKVYHSDIDRPAYASPENPDAFALVIGIDKYSALPEADFAERDAVAVREHLLALGYPERNVVLLRGSQAGKAGIEKYVESWLPRNTKEASRVFVYFSGHGAPDPKTGKAYLVPWDGDPQFLENTGYPVKRLYEKLESLKAREVLVVLDSCFSGAGGRSVLVKGARPLVAQADAAAEPSGKLVVLAAASSDEITGTDASQGHGLFTYYFLKGLGGEAKDARGQVSAKSLHDYLSPKVRDAARRQNRDQTPVLAGASPAETVLRKP